MAGDAAHQRLGRRGDPRLAGTYQAHGGTGVVQLYHGRDRQRRPGHGTSSCAAARKDVSTGVFAGARRCAAGTFELGTGAKLTGDARERDGQRHRAPRRPRAGRLRRRHARRRRDARDHRHAGVDGRQDGRPGHARRVAQGGTLILNGIASLTARPRAREPRADRRPRHRDALRRLRGRRPSCSTTSARSARPRAPELDDRRAAAQRRHRRRQGRRAAARGRHARRRTRARSPARTPPTASSSSARARSRARCSCTGTTEIADDVTVRAGDTLVARRRASCRRAGGDLRGDVTRHGHAELGRRPPGRRRARPPWPRAAGSSSPACAAFGCGSPSLDAGRRLVNQGLLRLEKGADLFSNGTPRATIDNAGADRAGRATTARAAPPRISGDALLRNTGTIEAGGTAAHLRPHARQRRHDHGRARRSRATRRSATPARSADVKLADGVLALEPGATWAGTTELADGELRSPPGCAARGRRRHAAHDRRHRRRRGHADRHRHARVGPTATRPARARPCSPRAPPASINDSTRRCDEDRALVQPRHADARRRHAVHRPGASMLQRRRVRARRPAAPTTRRVPLRLRRRGLIHNTGTLRKTGTGTAVAEAPIDNDGAIEVPDGTLELPELLNCSGTFSGGRSGTLSSGTYVVGAGALVLPGPREGQRRPAGARRRLAGALQAARRARRRAEDALGGSAAQRRGGRWSSPRALADVSATFVNEGALALGAGSTLTAGGFRAGRRRRPAPGGGRRRERRPRRRDRRRVARRPPRRAAPAAVDGDIPLLTASSVAGTFGAVTGGYDPIYGATDVKLRRHGGEAPTLRASAPDAANTVDTAPQATTTGGVVRIDVGPPRFRPLGGRRARRDRPRPVAGRRDLPALRLGAGLVGRNDAHDVVAVEEARAAHDRARAHPDVSAAATCACARRPSGA